MTTKEIITAANKGLGKMGAEVLNLSIRNSINISGLLNIRASISPTSPSPKPLCASLRTVCKTERILKKIWYRKKQYKLRLILAN